MAPVRERPKTYAKPVAVLRAGHPHSFHMSVRSQPGGKAAAEAIAAPRRSTQVHDAQIHGLAQAALVRAAFVALGKPRALLVGIAVLHRRAGHCGPTRRAPGRGRAVEHGVPGPFRAASAEHRRRGARRAARPCRPARLGAHRAHRRPPLERDRQPARAVQAASHRSGRPPPFRYVFGALAHWSPSGDLTTGWWQTKQSTASTCLAPKRDTGVPSNDTPSTLPLSSAIDRVCSDKPQLCALLLIIGKVNHRLPIDSNFRLDLY